MAGAAVRYALGALTAALYGFVAEKYRTITIASGVPFGAAVWLFAEEMALPVTGLSDTPNKYPIRDHFNALTAHLFFGFTMELTRKWTRKLPATGGKEFSHHSRGWSML